jgi:hypothetical protein
MKIVAALVLLALVGCAAEIRATLPSSLSTLPDAGPYRCSGCQPDP